MMHQYLASDADVEVIDISHVSSTSISIFTFTFSTSTSTSTRDKYANQPIGEWNVGAVTDMADMFLSCPISNVNKPQRMR